MIRIHRIIDPFRCNCHFRFTLLSLWERFPHGKFGRFLMHTIVPAGQNWSTSASSWSSRQRPTTGSWRRWRTRSCTRCPPRRETSWRTRAPSRSSTPPRPWPSKSPRNRRWMTCCCCCYCGCCCSCCCCRCFVFVVAVCYLLLVLVLLVFVIYCCCCCCCGCGGGSGGPE